MPESQAFSQASSQAALPENAVEIEGLSKTYAPAHNQPAKHALKNVSLNIPRGSFFALLGPNGAGKSTLINILAGLVVKTSGAARIWGFDTDADMRRARRAIGVVPQELNIDPFFTPREVLELQAGMYGVPARERRTDEILKAVGLQDKANAYARTLSGGMRRRLLVAKALVHSPQVLVLDEPTAGVDVELRRQLWDYVRELNAQGTTILLTTHYLEEAEALCDHIAIINHGRVIASEPKTTMVSRLDSKCVTITLDTPLEHIPESLAAFNTSLTDPNKLAIQYAPSQTDSQSILRAVHEAGLSFSELTTKEPELEDIFIMLTQQPEQAETETTV